MAETVYLVDGVRTPIGRYGGGLSPVRADDLAARVLGTLMDRHPSVDWEAVDDVVMGCVNQSGEDNRNVARMASLLAGLPVAVPGVTVNRLCGSGLDAVVTAARAVRAGEGDLFIAAGVESMTRAPYVMSKQSTPWGRAPEVFDTTIGWRFVNPEMHRMYGTESMPETAQNLADEHAISREDQDLFAVRSQERAAKAIADGRFVREIVPMEIDTDEHPRATTFDKLASLRPITANGTITAGNSSGVNDGAGAVLIASEKAVTTYSLTPLARITAGATAGVQPRTMGIGPVPATRKLLDRNRVGITDFDVVELNEAFAAQALAVLRELGLPDDAEHVNPNGGAIALGHPLGASGIRLALTAVLEMRERAARRALATMCIGIGQGISVMFESI